MTLDLLLFFVSLGLMAAAVIMRRPAATLALLTVAQWYLGAQLLGQTSVQALADAPDGLVEFGFRLSLPLIGLLLLKRQPRKPDAIHFLLIVVWAITFTGLGLQLLSPSLQPGGGYFYNLLQSYQLELFVGLVGLSFVSNVGGRVKKKK